MGIKNISDLTPTQKARAIREYVAKKGNKLPAKVKGRCLMRAGRLEKVSQSSNMRPKQKELPFLKSAAKLWSVSRDESNKQTIFASGETKLVGVTPEEYDIFRRFKDLMNQGAIGIAVEKK